LKAFVKKEPLIVKLYNNGEYSDVFIQKSITLDKLVDTFRKSLSLEFTAKNVFIINNSEKINIVDFAAVKDLAEYLHDGKEFQIIENFKEGVIDVVLKFDLDIRAIEFNKSDHFGLVIDKCEEVFNLDFHNYRLKFGSVFYDRLDASKPLEKMSSEFTILFEVVKSEKHPYVVELFIIDDDYVKTKQKTLIKFEADHTPTIKEVVAFLKEKRNFDESNMIFYKLNVFEEPTKRMKIKNCTLKNFEIEEKVKIMVKGTSAELDFETMKFVIYTSTSYPEDLQKQFEVKTPFEWVLRDFKTQVVDQLKNVDPYFDQPAENFTFQTLNAFNLPGKYLQKDDTIVKKTLFMSNKILVRTRTPEVALKANELCVFLRMRITTERKYDGYREVFIPEKFRNLSKKNFEAFRSFVGELLEIESKSLSDLKLTVVDYKNFCWKLIEAKDTTIKDGDEIGYLISSSENAKDDFQTDELIALRYSDNRENYVFNYKFVKETPFSINLDN
jgi:hypothetical protein